MFPLEDKDKRLTERLKSNFKSGLLRCLLPAELGTIELD